MFSRTTNDPRFRRRLNNLSHNIEAANESAQQGIFTFGHRYINPCISNAGDCVHSWTATCFPSREERLRRSRSRGRGGPELNFDFYDDWDEDEDLGWGNDELDRLLTNSQGYSTITAQPTRQNGMSYGNRSGPKGRKKSAVPPHDGGPDPTIIPSSSYFGFLGRFNVGTKGLKYKPSAADLQEHPGALRRSAEEEQPLIEESEDEMARLGKSRHMRQRSTTNASGHTTDSLSSRGDIFPSEDELDDAIPLDDEFAMVLERRHTGQGDESSSGRTRSSKRPSGSRMSIRTVSSKSIHDALKIPSQAGLETIQASQDVQVVPTLSELKVEDRRAEEEEEADVQRKRIAAKRLAMKRGLGDSELPSSPPDMRVVASSPALSSPMTESSAPVSPITHHRNPRKAYPFPSFEVQAPIEEDANTAEVDDEEPVSPIQEDELPSQPVAEANFIPARLPRFASGHD